MLALLFSLALCLPAAAQTPPEPRASRFGVVIVCDGRSAPEVEIDLEAAAGLGVGWVRLLPDWTRVQPTRASSDWSFLDHLLQGAERHNLSVLLTLGNTPRWASRYPDEPGIEVWNLNAPQGSADWQAYVQSLVQRYGGKVPAWQIWERSAIHFFRGSDKDLLELSRHTPVGSAPLLFPEPGGVNLGAINRIYLAGAHRSVQGLALYPSFERPEQILRPLNVLRTEILGKKGPPLRLWISGFGWGVEPLAGPLRSPLVDESDQASYLVRLATLALANGVERVFWQTMRDHGRGGYQVQSHSGLLRLDGSPRPAYQAYRNLIVQLGDRPLLSQASWGPHAFGCLFGTMGGEGVLVAWTDRPPVHLAQPPPGAVESAVDLLGKPVRGEFARLGPSPVFFRGSASDLTAWAQTPPVLAAVASPDRSGASEVSARLAGLHPLDDGLAVRTAAQDVRQVELEGEAAWSTDLAREKAFILFDVDDSFAYFIDGRYALEVEVVVYGNTGTQPMGFNLGYNGVKGYSFTRWQVVEPGPGWKTYSFRIPDADFSDQLSDFRLNALGSRADITVLSVRVSR